MLSRLFLLTFPVILVCTVVSAAQNGFQNGLEMTTTKAPWALRIVGQNLDINDVQAKPDHASAYFMTSSDTTQLNVSVFVEPIDKCKTAEACRDYVLGLGNPEWGKFQDLAKGKIGDASYFEFYRPEVKGAPLRMLDMYAEFVRDGYWVDMHISKTSYEKKDHALFESVVNASQFLPKTANQATPFDAQLGRAEAATGAWLSLWDSLKCKESYAALTAVSREGVGEKEWTEYCSTYAGGMGKNTSRNLIAAAFVDSMPPKVDRPLAVLAYQADFAKKSDAVELVALVLEKDGRWTISNHLFQ